MKWHWVIDNNYEWMSHAISETLLTPVMESLHERGLLNYKVDEIVDPLSFDLPGMASMDRKELKVEIDGLTIEMPCTDWELIHGMLKRREVRTDAAAPYFKLHGFLRCICLTPEQRDEMLAQMAAQMQEANAFREIENRRFNDAMSEAFAVADSPQDADAAIERAKAEGKNVHVLVARRPTKDDIGEA